MGYPKECPMQAYATTQTTVWPARKWENFCDQLRSSRPNGEEALGFVFLKPSEHDPNRYTAEAFYVPWDNDFEQRSVGYLSLKGKVGLRMYHLAHQNGWEVAHFHTHPPGYAPAFSVIDDDNDRQWASSLTHLYSGMKHFTAVLSYDLTAASMRCWIGAHMVDVDWEFVP
jgi:hypothetical protein